MSSYPDDRYEDRRDDRFDEGRRDDRPDSRGLERGRAAVGPPGLFLILNGLFGLVIIGLLSIPMVFDPDMMVRSLKDFVAKQPAGEQKQDMEKQVEELENKINQDRDAMVLQNAAELAVGGILNLLAILGGIMMRSLKSYGWGMAGSIVSLIPCATGCCCTGIPFGIWALIVLSRPDVKAAFAAARSARLGNPDDQYMR